ncbi:hypothetical protein EET67_01180 [Pseudaminobacter arsenicus]|uniref:Uncharacterized protein n=1 Tax=Borborobacter arsenicus TaxID=1851146 RepID=A0A432VBN1_9HYPH|nr:hypothetical protein [Pseudaminobacter arsenicus]RUM99545.1 hypothetical protein EET67_01180 [Pseudaminobacter arsenicus]
MKRTLTLAAASMIAIAGLSGASYAEDAMKPAAGATTGAESGATGTTTIAPDAGTTGSVSADVNFDDVISSIRNAKSDADQIGTLTEASNVKVVKVGDLATGENATALETALSENKEQVTELQAAVEANTALKAELEKQQVQASSVVAAKTEADGSITVFVQ